MEQRGDDVAGRENAGVDELLHKVEPKRIERKREKKLSFQLKMDKMKSTQIQLTIGDNQTCRNGHQRDLCHVMCCSGFAHIEFGQRTGNEFSNRIWIQFEWLHSIWA